MEDALRKHRPQARQTEAGEWVGAEIGKAGSDLLVKIAASAALYFALLFRVGSGETDSNEGSADVGRDCHKLNKCGTCARGVERGVQLSVALKPGLLKEGGAPKGFARSYPYTFYLHVII